MYGRVLFPLLLGENKLLGSMLPVVVVLNLFASSPWLFVGLLLFLTRATHFFFLIVCLFVFGRVV